MSMASSEHDENSTQPVNESSQSSGQDDSKDFTQFVEGGFGDSRRVDESPNLDAIDGASDVVPNNVNEPRGSGKQHPLSDDVADRNAPYAPADHTPAGPNDDGVA